jgi:hypothetical protein
MPWLGAWRMGTAAMCSGPSMATHGACRTAKGVCVRAIASLYKGAISRVSRGVSALQLSEDASFLIEMHFSYLLSRLCWQRWQHPRWMYHLPVPANLRASPPRSVMDGTISTRPQRGGNGPNAITANRIHALVMVVGKWHAVVVILLQCKLSYIVQSGCAAVNV